MYAKVFSRIVESSLMETPLEVRYTFVFLLAIADPKGYVIGTDIAIARRLNMPLDEFERCVSALKQPDPNSNSKEEEGRRVIDSDIERGYKIVNYVTYRDLRNAEERREYMRGYMRRRRANKANGVDESENVSELAEEGSRKQEAAPKPPEGFDEFYQLYPNKKAPKKARQSWNSLKPNAALVATIMDDVARKKISYDWTKENGRFIPMPATYLNQRRWEDQATTISGSPVIAKVARYDRTRNTAVLTAWMKRMSAEGYDDGDITRACNEIYNTAEEDLTVEEIDRMSHSCAHPRKKWKGIANSNLTFP